MQDEKEPGFIKVGREKVCRNPSCTFSRNMFFTDLELGLGIAKR
jgi:hypothetical protein